MSREIISLTTDFGLSDHYVGVMKAVILSLNAEAQIVDLCHQIEPYDLLGAALCLGASYTYFPAKTVHLVVVDPGSWLFVAPDNGVLELIYQRHPHKVWALRTEEFALRPTSQTFHGRDIFAPAAALLSKNTQPSQLGDPIDDFVRLTIPRPASLGSGNRRGTVLKVDRFGNLITNLQLSDLPGKFLLKVGDAQVKTLRPSYAAAAPGEVFLIAGSSGYLEISMNQGSAAEATGARAGAAIEMVDTGIPE